MSPALPGADADRLIHEPARRQIMTVLYAMDSADFLYLLGDTGLTKGNLSSHLSKLEAAGYVRIREDLPREGAAHDLQPHTRGTPGIPGVSRVLEEGPGDHEVEAMNTFAITTSGEAGAELTTGFPRGEARYHYKRERRARRAGSSLTHRLRLR